MLMHDCECEYRKWKINNVYKRGMLIACRSMYMRVTYEITNKYRVHACTRPDRYIYLLLRRKEKGTSDFGTNYKFPCMIRFKKYVPYVIHGERIVRVSGLNFGKKMKAKFFERAFSCGYASGIVWKICYKRVDHANFPCVNQGYIFHLVERNENQRAHNKFYQKFVSYFFFFFLIRIENSEGKTLAVAIRDLPPSVAYFQRYVCPPFNCTYE